MSIKDSEQFIKDLFAMVAYLVKQGKHSDSEILFNVIHDLSGVVNEEPCFLPSCTGYFEKWIKEHIDEFFKQGDKGDERTH